MAKLKYLRPEIEEFKKIIYFTEDEEKILDMWSNNKTILEMSFELTMSTATISRRKKLILDKIKMLKK